eukprot:TRINITY_DN23307_c0_g1_i1.p1 TRINITY_DN23307_c0_g1~~TRINITY_DN23307_c0_g1_i1.p1  ORF type:complete len:393 (-),score=81.60 TRINITY_DN23307_c0_g1_i1:184-1362(-)
MLLRRVCPAVRHSSLAQQVARRGLGDSVVGPPITDLQGNLRIAQNFFTKRALSYGEYKQQCVSLRVFVFPAVVASCVLSLMAFPPNSSYFATWSPYYVFSGIKSMFAGSSPPLFLTKKLEREVNPVALAADAEAEYLGLRKPSKPSSSTSKTTPAPPSSSTSKSKATTAATSATGAEPSSAPAAAKAMNEDVPRVLFVLGGPGAGKGTQCEKILNEFPEWAHISAGDCLRAERQNPKSKDGEMINKIIKEGNIVPVEITVKLLQNAMAAEMANGKKSFLIDGFPRNLDNVTGWEREVGDKAQVLGVLYFTASEAAMEKRLLGRGATSGRVDDNLETIRKRFRTYQQETVPIIKKYQEKAMVYSIDGMPTAEEVFMHTRYKIRSIDLIQKFGP